MCISKPTEEVDTIENEDNNFCYTVRLAAQNSERGTRRLSRFDWKLDNGASSTVASTDDKQKYPTESSVQSPSTEAGVSFRGRTCTKCRKPWQSQYLNKPSMKMPLVSTSEGDDLVM